MMCVFDEKINFKY